MVLLLGYGPDSPPGKIPLQGRYKIEDRPPTDSSEKGEAMQQPEIAPRVFSWRLAVQFLMWAIVWSVYVLALCGLCTKEYGGLQEMFNRYWKNIISSCPSMLFHLAADEFSTFCLYCKQLNGILIEMAVHSRLIVVQDD